MRSAEVSANLSNVSHGNVLHIAESKLDGVAEIASLFDAGVRGREDLRFIVVLDPRGEFQVTHFTHRAWSTYEPYANPPSARQAASGRVM